METWHQLSRLSNRMSKIKTSPLLILLHVFTLIGFMAPNLLYADNLSISVTELTEKSGGKRSKEEIDRLTRQMRDQIKAGLTETPSERWLKKNKGDKKKYAVQKDFAHAVHAAENLAQKVSQKQQQGQAFSEELADLLDKKRLIEESDAALQLIFSETEQRCKSEGFSNTILERHNRMVEGHNKNVRILLEYFDELAQLVQENALEEVPALMQRISDFLETYKTIKEPPLLSNALPHGMRILEAPTLERDTKVVPSMAPTKMEKQDWKTIIKSAPSAANLGVEESVVTSMAVSGPPTTEDLDPTIDVQITQEIIDLAADLNNSPLKIYQYVRNNMDFEPYLGSRKGSQETLNQESGNDYDLSSLLIALLRAANIPARYVRGTVELPVNKAMNWLGVEDAATAGSILTTVGMEGVNIMDDGGVVAVRFKHVWVEAYIPYTNYRGIPADNTGKMWVPMDPSFKSYTYQTGLDILKEMGFDPEAFIDDYITNFHEPSPVELMMQQIQDYLTINYPEMAYEDIVRTREILTEDLGFIPGSLPFEILTIDDDFAEIPDNKRYKMRFHLYNGGTTFIDYIANLPEIAGKRITISYIAATQADQDVIDSYGDLYDTPPYLVNLKPVLKIDGTDMAVGIGSIGMGVTHSSDMHFTTPGGETNEMPVVSNSIIAGTYQAVGVDTGRISSDIFEPISTAGTPTTDDWYGGRLWQTAMGYLSRIEQYDEEVAKTMQMVVTKDVSEAIVEDTILVTFSFGTPNTFEPKGLVVDADRCIVGPFAVNGDDSKNKKFMVLSGADGSISENRIFEDMYNEEAVSTIKILELSSDAGIPIFVFNSGNIGTIYSSLNLSSSVEHAIYNAVLNGHEVTVPRDSITYLEWTGTGYIDMNPATGAAGYIISGGHAGGATVDTWTAWFFSLKKITGITAFISRPDKDYEYFPYNSPQLWFEVEYTLTYEDGSTSPTPDRRIFRPHWWAYPYSAGDYSFYAGADNNPERKFVVFEVEIDTPDGEKCIADCDTITLETKFTPSAPPSATYKWEKSWSMGCLFGSGDGTYTPDNAASTEFKGTVGGDLASKVEVTNTYGSTDAKKCLKVIDVKSIKAEDGSNEKEDVDPSSSVTGTNTIYVARSDTGVVDITVETDPSVSVAELPASWDNIRKRAGSGSLTLASTGKLSATVKKDIVGELIVEMMPCAGYSKSFEIKVVVVGLEQIEVRDKNHPANTETATDISTVPDLYVGETSAHEANLEITATINPDTAAERARVYWEIDGNDAIPSNGDFGSSAMVNVTIDESNILGNNNFVVKAGVDQDDNGSLGSSEVTHKLNVHFIEFDELKVSDKNNSSVSVTVNESTPSYKLWIIENTLGSTVITLDPDIDNDKPKFRKHVLWTVTGDAATNLSGTFEMGNIDITLAPTAENPDRKFVVKAGTDVDNNGSLESGEVQYEVEVVVGVVSIKAGDSDDAANFVEDGDKTIEANLKTLYVYRKDTGTVNITVETNPSVSESDLPSDWIIEKVSGSLNLDGTSGKLSAQIKKDTPGEIVVRVLPSSGSTDHFQVKVTVVQVQLKAVWFGGTNYHPIAKDDGSGNYTNNPLTNPHWEDNSSPLDGDNDDSGDNKYPVCFTRNTRMKVSVKMIVDPPSAFTGSVKIKGDGNSSLDIPETTANLSGNELTIISVEAADAFVNKIDIFDSTVTSTLDLVWYVAPNSAANFLEVGTTKHQVYVTLNDPDPSVTVFHTVVHIGCDKARGKDGTPSSDVVTGIWAEFSDRIVKRIDGTQLKYWLPQSATATNTADLLKDGNGQCGSWAEFFIDCLKVQRITGSNKITIVEKTSPMTDLFLVKNWIFIGTGVSPGTAPYVYVMYTDANDQSGAPGQGNPDPPDAFYNHFIVLWGGNYYDPSYGTGPFADQASWENNSLDGFATAGTYMGTSAWFVKKNNPAVIETTFIIP
ncbi:MAG: transglutaminase domain-containing protein [Desulfobacterales bacterium]|nr:transglutaminase domain-containing protein [Desulfobacterales bacterium]